MTRTLSLWLPVAIYMGAIFLVSADSSPPAPARVSDKVLHLGAYAGLAVTICRALAGGLPSRLSARVMAIAFASTVAYGTSDELHQMFVPGRSPDVYDVVADAAGAAVGLFGCWAWGIIRAPGSHLPPTNSSI